MLTRLQRIAQWFHNTTRPSTASTRNVIKIKTLNKLPAEWQAYQTLYYEQKLKALVDSRYKAYCNGLEPGKTPQSRISFQTEVVRAEYWKETPEVRAAVQKHRQQLKTASKAESTPDKLAAFQKYVRFT